MKPPTPNTSAPRKTRGPKSLKVDTALLLDAAQSVFSTSGMSGASIRAIAKKAIEKKTGARALRQLLESLMLDMMYELPARKDPREYVITDKNVRGEEPVVARPLKAAKKEADSKKETA